MWASHISLNQEFIKIFVLHLGVLTANASRCYYFKQNHNLHSTKPTGWLPERSQASLKIAQIDLFSSNKRPWRYDFMTLYMQLFLSPGVLVPAVNYLKCYSMVVVSSLPLCWNKKGRSAAFFVFTCYVLYMQKALSQRIGECEHQW